MWLRVGSRNKCRACGGLIGRWFLLVTLIGFSVNGTSFGADAMRAMINLRGDQVLVPCVVPTKERFVLQRLISVDDRFIVFLYRDPRFRRPVDYAETYNLAGELLEIAWYKPTGGFVRARDISLGNPKATRPARVLHVIHDRGDRRRRPDALAGKNRLFLQSF